MTVRMTDRQADGSGSIVASVTTVREGGTEIERGREVQVEGGRE